MQHQVQNGMCGCRLGEVALTFFRNQIQDLDKCPNREEFVELAKIMADESGLAQEDVELFLATLICEEFEHEVKFFTN